MKAFAETFKECVFMSFYIYFNSHCEGAYENIYIYTHTHIYIYIYIYMYSLAQSQYVIKIDIETQKKTHSFKRFGESLHQ